MKVRTVKINYELKQFTTNLNQEQQKAYEKILKHAITVIFGKAGSGKTLTAVYAALQLFLEKKVEKIIITRPTISEEEIGFLPGTLEEKMDPWVAPIYGNLDIIIGKQLREELVSKNLIEIVPMAYMRGRTFLDSAIIVDEIQNITHHQMEMILTRLGKSSKMVLCGDLAQNDLALKKKNSGLPFLVSLKDRIKNFSVVELQQNHRHPIVQDILELYSIWKAPQP